MNNEITLKTGDNSMLDDIQGLWEQLNALHMTKSPDFKHHYNTFTFTARKKSLLEKADNGRIFLVAAYDREVMIGYCVSSITGDSGEIDSIYVKPDYQNRRIGHMLMETSLNWFNANNTKAIDIAVSVGNEEVFGFYAKYGFKPRLTVLRQP